MHFFYVKKSGRVPFDMDSEANPYKCQVKEVAGEKNANVV